MHLIKPNLKIHVSFYVYNSIFARGHKTYSIVYTCIVLQYKHYDLYQKRQWILLKYNQFKTHNKTNNFL